MTRFEDREAVAAKIAWEGGWEPALEYGITVDDMPEGDSELQEAWADLRKAYKAAEQAWRAVDALLPDID